MRRTLMLSIAASVLTATAASAADALLIADTFVDAGRSTTAFGTLPYLSVGRATRTFLQFKMLPAEPGAVVLRAELRLYVTQVAQAGTILLGSAQGPWQENLTSLNAPGSTPNSSVGVATPRSWLTFDVTGLVASWLQSPGLNMGLVLSTSTDEVYLDSKESVSTSHLPVLSIELATRGAPGDAGGPGATGAQGPTGAKGTDGQDVKRSRLVWAEQFVTLAPRGQREDTTFCPVSHPNVLAGSCDGSTANDVEVRASAPVSGGWKCTTVNWSETILGFMKLSALCGP